MLAIDGTSSEPQAPAVLGQHLAVVIDVLDRMPDVVIEVRPESLIVSPPGDRASVSNRTRCCQRPHTDSAAALQATSSPDARYDTTPVSGGPQRGSPAGLHPGLTHRLDAGAAAGESSRVSSGEGLAGREAELALAAAAVRQLSEGRGSVLAIEGEAGIGKTRLVQSIVDDARSGGLAVFYGQAHPFERTRPFGVVAAALDLSRRSPDPRKAAIGALLAGERGGAPARTAGDIQHRVVEDIVDLVETLCVQRPVLLVAEDIHWADSASLLAILSVARQLPLAALLVVVTARPSPLPADLVRLLDDLVVGGARAPCNSSR